MIIDLKSFIEREQPFWDELELVVMKLEPRSSFRLDLAEARRLHYLYERAAASLSRIQTFSNDVDVTQRLESLVARAYGVIHSVQGQRRTTLIGWFLGTFPRTFRAHINAFWLSLGITLVGVAFGAFALAVDYKQAKRVLMPFERLQGSPSERVKQEEQGTGHHAGDEGLQSAFASMLMTHNVFVAVLAVALGLSFGVGTILLLFYNGVILGAVCYDYIAAGETTFLVGWLLPHGSIEIPSILLAGQAGLVLASALLGRGDRRRLKERLRALASDLVTLICGVGILLVWAGIIESFVSQYHKQVLPYWLKISFGCVELVLLAAFLGMSGRRQRAGEEDQI